MNKILSMLILCLLLPAACSPIPVQTMPLATEIVYIQPSETPQPTATDIPTPLPTPSATPSPLLLDQPVFLAWPLPAKIGTARISQYPNTPWGWHYLGLNEGYQCPPMFGYLTDLSSLPYWRDVSIPEEEDKSQADPHNFEMVECYSTEGDAGSNGHAGTDIKAPAGTPVYASAYGKIMDWRASGMTAMIVLKHCLGGSWTESGACVDGRQWYTTYMHIVPDQNLLEENKSIPQGTQLGTIYDQSINSHLHFEVGLDSRNYSNYVNPWGADESPWLGCMWLDQALCVSPDAQFQKISYISNTGEVYLQQGQDQAIAIPEAQAVQKMRLWGSRMAFTDAVNALFIRHAPSAEWQLAAADVQDFQISDTRTAMMDTQGTLWVREENENNPAAEWQEQARAVQAFSLSDERVGYLNVNGELFVKEGKLTTDWILVAEHVRAFQVIDNRIAYVDGNGDLYVNEGDLLTEFEPMGDQVRAFEVTNVRLGMLNHAGQFFVKEGNLRAEWVLQGESVQAFQLADVRMLMQDAQGIFFYKQGNLYQEWYGVAFADLRMVVLNGEMMVMVR